jgi:hypothetical protein
MLALTFAEAPRVSGIGFGTGGVEMFQKRDRLRFEIQIRPLDYFIECSVMDLSGLAVC